MNNLTLIGFSAVVVPYNYFLAMGFEEQLFVFGGITSDGVLNLDVYFTRAMGGSWLLHYQKLLQARKNHRSIVKDNIIYHIGGSKHRRDIEIWEMRWDHDPGLLDGYGGCPQYCNFDVFENIGGVCLKYEGDCEGDIPYHQDSPQFRQRLSNWNGTADVYFSNNPLTFLV